MISKLQQQQKLLKGSHTIVANFFTTIPGEKCSSLWLRLEALAKAVVKNALCGLTLFLKRNKKITNVNFLCHDLIFSLLTLLENKLVLLIGQQWKFSFKNVFLFLFYMYKKNSCLYCQFDLLFHSSVCKGGQNTNEQVPTV